jgi:hypothetical protein
MNKDIELNIVFEAQYLCDGYKEVLLRLYKEKFEEKSNKEGYIISINAVRSIKSAKLSNNNEIIVVSECNCNIIKPEKGLELSCKIDMIHVNGIFVNMRGIKMLIPNSDDYNYNNEYFIYKEDTYKIGDEIMVEIVNVRYDKFVYTCIGKLI